MISVNGITVTPTKFPDGTVQVWHLPLMVFQCCYADILWEFESLDEFFSIAQLQNLLSSQNILTELEIHFLPFARQDKKVSNDTTFGLHDFARLLNSLQFHRVTCLDPHSDVASRLIKNFKCIHGIERAKMAIGVAAASVLAFPDRGAADKYTPLFGDDFAIISAIKRRDQSNGEILSLDLDDQRPAWGRSVMIVDDICDGGRTFEILANCLKRAGAKEISLYVTYGLFTKGLRQMREAGISRFFSYKGEWSENHDGNLILKPWGNQ